MVRKTLQTLVLLALLGLAAGAQPPTVQASVDTYSVHEGESINLKVEVSGAGGEVETELPDMPEFEVYQTGSFSSTSIVNGLVSVGVAQNYTLVAKKAGRYKIGPISVEIAGQLYEADPIDVEVLPARHASPGSAGVPAATATPAPAHPGLLEPAPNGLDDTRPAFITAEVDRSTPYLNQQITYILKLYLSAAPIGPVGYEPPETTGFLVEELLPRSRTYATEVDGRRYYVVEARTALFATSPGKHELNPARVQVTLQDSLASVFRNDPFAYLAPPRDMSLETEPVAVDVRPLPEEGRPANFSGAVGQYSLTATLDKSSVAAGQPVHLEMTVSGQGNVNLIGTPALPELKKFRVYDTQATSQVEKKDYEVTGTRVFKTVLVPLEEGRQTLTGLRFSFFNPETERYETIEAPPLTLDVTPGKVSRRDLPTPVEDKLSGQKTSLGSKPLKLQAPAWLGWLQALPLLTLGAAFAWRAFRRWQEASSGARRQSQALRRANRQLRRLRSLSPEEGGRVVLSAVHQFFADRLGTITAGLSLEELDRLLCERGLSPELRQRLRGELQAAEEARYAPTRQSLGEHEKPLCRVLFEIEEALR